MEQKKTNSARQVALDALTACQRQGAWSDGILRNLIRSAGLDRRDAALASRICYGVQQKLLLLDFWIDRFSSVKAAKLEPKIANCIRIGMYQMACMDKIPTSAAVNESVELAKRSSKNRRAAGLVNGVLRAFSRQLDTLPQPEGKERLSIQYSHPGWLVDLFRAELGEAGTEALLQENNSEPPTCIQVNPLKADAGQVQAELEAAGVQVQPHPWLEGCLLATHTGNLEEMPSFQAGAWTVQDAAAKLAVMACDPQPGERILDVCAAPGGKSFAAAMAMQNRGSILACDIHPHKEALIAEGANRLGITILSTQIQDGKQFRPEWESAFDRLIVDVPCSGLGIIRKKPDIRYKDPKQLEGLPRVQSAILENVSRYVRPGGVLLYATCTVLRRENQDIVNGFLAAHPEFFPEAVTLPGPVGTVESGMVTLWPHIHGTDGFFFARLRKM
ncbi:MAG: 16S rRNA (cytosine(967)-C(5))-methyltransferase RsmB [Oscillospiraceae bacterium]|nr:16S rRNA (cytosine(967)-C(5))-methyltransferase RsmB [Oscillospiraceae bacterium]